MEDWLIIIVVVMVIYTVYPFIKDYRNNKNYLR